jgi:organic radical activating enzyme
MENINMLDRINQKLNEYEHESLKSDFQEIVFEIFNFLKKKKIIIYPAGMNGQLIQATLKMNNIKVEYFIDKAYENLKIIDGIDVKSVDNLKYLNQDYLIIISTNLKTQYDFLKDYVYELNKELSVIDGKNLNRMLKMPICNTRLENNEIFDLLECENCGFERLHCKVATKYLKKISKHKEIENEYKSTKFDWFGYIVSQTCTLKCEHCCEHVPYQKGKGFTSVEIIVKDVKKLANSSNFLSFVELVGGEPFLHPEIEQLVTELLKIENIGYIKSFTNGTVIPSDKLCKIMRNPRFMLHVSNYELSTKGKLLDNIYKTRTKLDNFGVKYLFAKTFEWLDFTSFDKHEESDEYMKQAFNKCFLKNCSRVYNGKLYRCPHQYAGVQLQKLKEIPMECLDIHSSDTRSLGKDLDSFEDLDFIEACKHCELAFNPKSVPAGMQLS